nr:hypothetical protein Q903MT_gene6564 [Picea sitchensis]
MLWIPSVDYHFSYSCACQLLIFPHNLKSWQCNSGETFPLPRDLYFSARVQPLCWTPSWTLVYSFEPTPGISEQNDQ